MNPSLTCQFHEGEFRIKGVGTLKPEEGKQVITMLASDITFLNLYRSRGITAVRMDTNILRYVFYVGLSIQGAILAIFMEFFKIANSKRKYKANNRIIVKFVNGRMISGYTDIETFFTVQNAWLDNRPQIKTNLETNQ